MLIEKWKHGNTYLEKVDPVGVGCDRAGLTRSQRLSQSMSELRLGPKADKYMFNKVEQSQKADYAGAAS